MKQLDRWNKELEWLSAATYEEVSLETYDFYKKALKQLKKEIKGYIDNYDNLSFSKKLEVENQIAIAKRIDEIVAVMNDSTTQVIRRQIESEINNGYYGVWYALEGAENIQLNFPILDERYISRLINDPIDGVTFSKRLYKHQSELAKRATNELLMGAVRGDGYEVVAKKVAEQTEASYKQALRIARTEGGRARSQAKQRAYRAAQRQGVNMEKMWLATLDKKTRHSHQILDGKTVGVREQFVFKGNYADGPRLFGVAGLDINCRCTTVAVVNGVKPELRKDSESKDIINYKNYQEWADERVGALNKGMRSVLSKKQQAVYDKQINQAPEKARNLWEKYKRELSLKDANRKSGAFYRANDGVYMNVDNDIKGSYYSPSGNTFFHEFGHNIDFIAAKGKNEFITAEKVLSNGKTLGETIFKEVRDHIKNAPGKDKIERHKALKEALKKEYEENVASMASLSDLFGGATSNQLNLGIGHSNSYWKPSKYSKKTAAVHRNEQLGVEGFAEMYAAMFTNPEELEKFEKWLPESYNMFEELVDFIIEGTD